MPFQHDQFHYVVLSRYCLFAVVVDFVCVFRCNRPHIQVRLLDARDIEYRAFEHQHFLRLDSLRLDRRRSMCSQPVVDCAHELSSFIAVETPNSAQQQLYVHHRFSDCFAAFVCRRFDKTKACVPSQCNHQILRLVVGQWHFPVRSAQTSPTVSLSSFGDVYRPLFVMDVHVVHPESNWRYPPRNCSMLTKFMRQQPPSTEPCVSKVGKANRAFPPTR